MGIKQTAEDGAPKRRLAVVMTVHNRRALTLRCLRSLSRQEAVNIDLDIHLFDDGCTDGTSESVIEEFGDVTIIKGDGHAFWGGGMHGAMLSALETEFDDLLWLNDDVSLSNNALATLFHARDQAVRKSPNEAHIIVGAVTDPDTGRISYSGHRRKGRISPVRLESIASLQEGLTPCDTMNGNCVLFTAEIIRRLGPNDPQLIHQLGDIDYGYRATKLGFKIWIAPEPVGECAPNPGPQNTLEKASLAERWRALTGPKGLPLRPWLHFMWRHAGPIGLLELAAIYMKRLVSR